MIISYQLFCLHFFKLSETILSSISLMQFTHIPLENFILFSLNIPLVSLSQNTQPAKAASSLNPNWVSGIVDGDGSFFFTLIRNK